MGVAEQEASDGPLSIWLPQAGLHSRLDVSFSVYTRGTAVMINYRQSAIDTTLFVRPFTSAAWATIAAACVTLAVCLWYQPHLFSGFTLFSSKDADSSGSKRIIVLSFWLLFVLLNAFYGGALTMFFSSPPSLPFSSLSEALDRFDMVMAEEEGVFVKQMVRTSPKTKGPWEKMVKDGRMKETFDEALKMLRSPGHFIYGSVDLVVPVYLQGEYGPRLDLQTLAPETKLQSCLYFPKYSPLTEVFNHGKYSKALASSVHTLRIHGLGLLIQRGITMSLLQIYFLQGS